MPESESASGRFETLAEYRLVLDRVIDVAQRQVRVFDRNLEGMGFNSPERFESLRAFLSRNHQHRLQIILHELGHVERECPRLLMLHRQFSHAVSILQTLPEVRAVSDGLVLVDEAHFVRRFHFDHPRGAWGMNNVSQTRPMLQRYDEIAAASAVGLVAHPFGL